MAVMKKIIFLALLAFVPSSHSFVVLIDPGHGGEESGAVSHYKEGSKNITIFEKDLSLELAKKLKSLLDKKFTTYLTRSFDRTVSLEERAEMADTVKANLFISIHFNSTKNKDSHGVETYYLSNKQDAAVKKVEKVENSSHNGEEKVVHQILIDLVIQKTTHFSKRLASSIHGKLVRGVVKNYRLKDRGIKGGLFYVLALSKRPGVLIEAGFISNSEEMGKIRTKSYLDDYASDIYKGIIEYQSKLPKKKLPLF